MGIPPEGYDERKQAHLDLFRAARQFETEAIIEVSVALPPERAEQFADLRGERPILFRTQGDFTIPGLLEGSDDISVNRFDSDGDIYAVHVLNNTADRGPDDYRPGVAIVIPSEDYPVRLDEFRALLSDIGTIYEENRLAGPKGYLEEYTRHSELPTLSTADMVALRGVIQVVELDVEQTIIENHL